MIGRHRSSGAPLGRSHEFDPIPLGDDTIPPDAHARLASPRSNGGITLLRRGYSYDNGDDAGLLLLLYQRDPRRQFIPLQRRLSEHDALTRLTRPVGSAIFAIPPGTSAGRGDRSRPAARGLRARPWRTRRSPTAWTRSRRCSSSPRRTRTRRAPTGGPRRRSATRRFRSPSWCGPGGCASCAGSGPGSRRGCASSSRPARSPSWRSSSASSRPDLVGLGRYLGLGAKRSVELARALDVRTRRRAARGGGRRPAAERAGDRAEDRGAAARGARPRGRAATASRAAAQPRLGARRRRGGGARRRGRPATCGAGATPASCWRWSAPRRIRAPCWRGSPRCPRSWRWSSRASGARSG